MPEKIKYVNLTPHPIVVFSCSDSSGSKKPILELKPSGQVARVETVENLEAMMPPGIPVMRNEYTKITGLPEPSEGEIYIVSSIVAAAIKNDEELRKKYDGHLLVPNTAPTRWGAVRDEEGRIRGVCSFIDPLIHRPVKVKNDDQ